MEKRPRLSAVDGAQVPQRKKARELPPSGFYGVTGRDGQWLAETTSGLQSHQLPTFDTKQEAALAYDKAARKSGEDKPLNYETIEAAEEAAEQAQVAHTLVAGSLLVKALSLPSSGFTGVTEKGKKWEAKIDYNGRKQHKLGSFDTKEEAALAFDRFARNCGEPKQLNFGSIEAAEEAAAQAQAEYTLTHVLGAGSGKLKPKNPSVGPMPGLRMRARTGVGQARPRARPASGFYGVTADKKRWKAQIAYGGKKHHIGRFDTREEAALAYDRAAMECGELKQLNYELVEPTEMPPSSNEVRLNLSEAHQNQTPRARTASGLYGVYTDRSKWRAEINCCGKQHRLGCFGTKEAAALAYDKAARKCKADRPLNYNNPTADEKPTPPNPLGTCEFCTNQRNSDGSHSVKPRPPSGFYGVGSTAGNNNGKRWTVQIIYGGAKHNLGRFETREEAALAYDREARQCGESKPLNYSSVEQAEEAASRAQVAHTLVAGPTPSISSSSPMRNSASAFYGVRANGKKWKAELEDVTAAGGFITRDLGSFKTREQAALAYDKAVRNGTQCGEKPLNFATLQAAEEAAARSITAYSTAAKSKSGTKRLRQSVPTGGAGGKKATSPGNRPHQHTLPTMAEGEIGPQIGAEAQQKGCLMQ
jgi:hypothetical protein